MSLAGWLVSQTPLGSPAGGGPTLTLNSHLCLRVELGLPSSWSGGPSCHLLAPPAPGACLCSCLLRAQLPTSPGQFAPHFQTPLHHTAQVWCLTIFSHQHPLTQQPLQKPSPQYVPSGLPLVNTPCSPFPADNIHHGSGWQQEPHPLHASPHADPLLLLGSPLSPPPCTAASTRPPCFHFLKHVIFSLTSSTLPAPTLSPTGCSSAWKVLALLGLFRLIHHQGHCSDVSPTS